MPAALLYLCVRPETGAGVAEYSSFREGTGLSEARLHRHDLVRDPLPPDALERYAGFVVGGSPFNVTDPASSKTDAQRRLEDDLEQVAQAALSQGAAALFTCYGIGVVTRLLGGEVSTRHPEDTGPTTVALTRAGGDDPLLGGLSPTFTALTAHKEGAADAPPGAELLATNDDCPVQAYRVGERLWATQFHPEPTPKAFTQRMAVYRDAGYFAARDYDDIAGRVLAASVTEPPRILRSFARAFA